MELAVAIVLLAALVTSSHASSHVEGAQFPLPIHLLRPLSGSGGHPLIGVSCVSWRVGVEANNVRGWTTIPSRCEGYVDHYMLGDLYRQDSALVTVEAAEAAEGLNLQGDGKDAWVFDIDETTLSNLPCYAHHGFGGLNVSGSSVAYKSGMRQKLEDEGHRIVGNKGDQWSDILGQPKGDRTFKFPDPMYYIS